MEKLNVNNAIIMVIQQENEGYISLTGKAKGKNDCSLATGITENWLRNRHNIEYRYIGGYYNLNFKAVEFDRFRTE